MPLFINMCKQHKVLMTGERAFRESPAAPLVWLSPRPPQERLPLRGRCRESGAGGGTGRARARRSRKRGGGGGPGRGARGCGEERRRCRWRLCPPARRRPWRTSSRCSWRRPRRWTWPSRCASSFSRATRAPRRRPSTAGPPRSSAGSARARSAARSTSTRVRWRPSSGRCHPPPLSPPSSVSPSPDSPGGPGGGSGPWAWRSRSQVRAGPGVGGLSCRQEAAGAAGPAPAACGMQAPRRSGVLQHPGVLGPRRAARVSWGVTWWQRREENALSPSSPPSQCLCASSS